MKHLSYLPGIIAAVCIMIVLAATSVGIVAYHTPGYFEDQYTKHQVLDDIPPMTMKDLLTVTEEMMAYLRGDREDLHVVTTIDGEQREFFNAREIAHMKDVRELFLKGMDIRILCIAGAVLSILFLFLWKKKEALKILPRSLAVGTGIFFVSVLALAGIISTDFNKYFFLFHEIFFDNDLWLLDPARDLLINIVPEPFFIDTALRVTVTFLVLAAVFLFFCLLMSRKKKPR